MIIFQITSIKNSKSI